MRWAVSEDKKDIFAGLGYGAALGIAALCALGRPESLIGFGMSALAQVTALSTVLMLVLCLSSQNGFFRACGTALCLLSASWGILAFPVRLEALIATVILGAVLIGVMGVIVFRLRWALKAEMASEQGHAGLIVINGFMALLSSGLEDQSLFILSVSLSLIILAARFWQITRFGHRLEENTQFIFAMGTSVLLWQGWVDGRLPLVSLLCLLLCLFTHKTTSSMLENKTPWLKSISFFIHFIFALLPAGIALAFVEILKKI